MDLSWKELHRWNLDNSLLPVYILPHSDVNRIPPKGISGHAIANRVSLEDNGTTLVIEKDVSMNVFNPLGDTMLPLLGSQTLNFYWRADPLNAFDAKTAMYSSLLNVRKDFGYNVIITGTSDVNPDAVSASSLQIYPIEALTVLPLMPDSLQEGSDGYGCLVNISVRHIVLDYDDLSAVLGDSELSISKHHTFTTVGSPAS